MLPIIFFILKLIGILLLIILGLILFILLAVLLVPVRYRAEGSWYGKPLGYLNCSWFLHLVSLTVRYREELEITFRLFGVRLFKERGRQAVKDLERAADDALKEGKDVLVQEAEEPDGDLILSSQELGAEEPDDVWNKPAGHGVESEYGERSHGHSGRPEYGEEAESSRESSQGKESGHRDHSAGKSAGWFSRLKARFRYTVKRLKASFTRFCLKWRQVSDFKQAVSEFLAEEENKKTLKLIKRQALKILRHLCPTRLEGTIRFGLEDPYTMGKILTAVSFLYPLYGARLILTPDFDQNILEGEIKLRGRIRIGTLLAAALRILFNKNFRKQLKKFLNRGGNEHGR